MTSTGCFQPTFLMLNCYKLTLYCVMRRTVATIPLVLTDLKFEIPRSCDMWHVFYCIIKTKHSLLDPATVQRLPLAICTVHVYMYMYCSLCPWLLCSFFCERRIHIGLLLTIMRPINQLDYLTRSIAVDYLPKTGLLYLYLHLGLLSVHSHHAWMDLTKPQVTETW